MKLFRVFLIGIVLISISGCGTGKGNIRILKIPRVDQDRESGNRGYIQGTPPPLEASCEDRYLEVLEIDLS